MSVSGGGDDRAGFDRSLAGRWGYGAAGAVESAVVVCLKVSFYYILRRTVSFIYNYAAQQSFILL